MEAMVIDWVRVDELRDDLGHDGFDEVVAIFIEEMGERIRLLQDKDPQAWAHDLHFIKGGAANLGFADLRHACLQAEQGMAVTPEEIVKCYTASKATFFSNAREVFAQIKTPERTSSSVMLR